MQLLSSWKESLYMFRPSGLKDFVLSTLKFWIEGFKTAGFWIVPLVALEAYATFASIQKWHAVNILLPILLAHTHVTTFFMLLFMAAARPEQGPKDMSYFLRRVRDIAVIELMLIALSVPILLFVQVRSVFYYPLIVMSALLANISIVAALLLFDSATFSLRALGQAIKNAIDFWWYNLPGCLLLMGVTPLIGWGASWVFALIPTSYSYLILGLAVQDTLKLILGFISICMWAAFYYARKPGSMAIQRSL